MSGHQARTLRIKTNHLVHADVDFGEIVLVEIITAQHFSSLEDILFLEFALRAKHIVSTVEFAVLRSHGARFRFVLRTEFVHIALKIRVLFAKFRNFNVFFCQFSAEVFCLFRQISNLRCKCSHRFLHLLAQFGVV